MHFLLQIDSDRAVRPDNFVGANAGISRHVSTGIRNAHVGGDVLNGMMGAFDGCGDEPFTEFLSGSWLCGLRRC